MKSSDEWVHLDIGGMYVSYPPGYFDRQDRAETEKAEAEMRQLESNTPFWNRVVVLSLLLSILALIVEYHLSRG